MSREVEQTGPSPGRAELLSQLRTCLAEPDEVMASRRALAASLKRLPGPRQGAFDEAVDALADASDPQALSLAAAKAMRLLMMQAPVSEETSGPTSAETRGDPDPESRRPMTSRERALARTARRQTRALAAERATPAQSPLDRPVESLSGVGRVIGQALRARGLATLGDLVWCLPLGYRDERRLVPFTELSAGAHVVTAGHVASARVGGRGRRMGEVLLRDAAGDELRLVWFRAPGGLMQRFSEGARFVVSGRVDEYRGQLCINHPTTKQLGVGEPAVGPGIVPRYPEVIGVAPRVLDKAIKGALAQALASVTDAVPAAVAAQTGLPGLVEALGQLHAPPQDLSDETLSRWNAHASPQHRRLAYEEFFLLELALHRRLSLERDVRAEPLLAAPAQLARVRGALGFALTGAQARVVEEIGRDLSADTPMRRLLQGDVGSGKTAVAMLAAAHAVSAGGQVAFMAPTEVLAQQHLRNLGPLCDALGLRIALLVGGARASHRRRVLAELAEGRLDLVVGTHALLGEGVAFARLRLAIVDEQHRFGVAQRLRLVDKGAGRSPHLLVMTATPIPRTLTLALHGDLAISVLDELPPGRVPPVTRAYPLSQRDRALKQVDRALARDGQAYVVCPAIEEADDPEVRTAEVAFRDLGQRFDSHGVALLHARLPPEEKQRAMDAFAAGDVRVLVATTVIEVGVDVPRANVILVEHAERFGLAQLHQLRGRVGRGGQTSACLLVHGAQGDEARRRIDVLCESHDGFEIAEEDLRLRGPGELFGRRQSGLPGFRFGDLRRDTELIERARDAARALLASDPELSAPENAGARAALWRLEADQRAVVKEEAG